MTKAELKNTLRRVGTLDCEIRVVNLKIERLESYMHGHAIRYDVDRVQTTPKDAMGELMAELEPLLKERDRLTVAITRAIADTSAIIDHIKDHKQCLVMHYRYTACLSFEEIARRMNYSEPRIFQLHNEAVNWLVDNCDGKKRKHYSKL